MSVDVDAVAASIEAGRGILGIEFGSTRIKACLIGDDVSTVLASGAFEWENELVGGVWNYSLDTVWAGVQEAYATLVADVQRQFNVAPKSFKAIGISAMMHGYLAFDEDGELLVPFRTWRNSSTGEAAAELTRLFDVNIPLRWSIAHLQQAVRDREPHVPKVRYLTTLAGYVHWKLTGRKVLGVGDASGMFPIDPATGDYDAALLDRYDGLVASGPLAVPLRDLLPEVLSAGRPAGELTVDGARLLDPAGVLQPGIQLAPPEGDAGTGMVATNAITPRTGNVSAGTSIFAMIVLERPLRELHSEIDIVTTPAGDPVAMVHCNNGASELAAWAGLFHRFSEAAGSPVDSDVVYDILFREALNGARDAGGLFAYNQLAGEPIAGLSAGRPLFVRTPESRMDLANVMRAQLYGVFGTLALGMRVLTDEGVALDRMYAHGGMFRTAGVAQRFVAGALDAPVSTSATAGEGGAWGMAVLAAYAASGAQTDLATFLTDSVFATTELATAVPDPDDVAGFAAYLDRYRDGLEIVRTAITALN
jgi:sugar (pentulose or hexulose) kinase